ncbi:uncharacterized protein LOC126077410 isoform X2 [Elephas maximus indicus]|uniref:uncharacterized protein LOC126077410 isoform X2 n=1 Tax=Elephas maximus indicus TaxID=99487 RepID=UPI002115F1D9|nr:uncharacterized protein LOC126077410 isoform X2 [Elephas maximus indicus]
MSVTLQCEHLVCTVSALWAWPVAAVSTPGLHGVGSVGVACHCSVNTRSARCRLCGRGLSLQCQHLVCTVSAVGVACHCSVNTRSARCRLCGRGLSLQCQHPVCTVSAVWAWPVTAVSTPGLHGVGSVGVACRCSVNTRSARCRLCGRGLSLQCQHPVCTVSALWAWPVTAVSTPGLHGVGSVGVACRCSVNTWSARCRLCGRGLSLQCQHLVCTVSALWAWPVTAVSTPGLHGVGSVGVACHCSVNTWSAEWASCGVTGEGLCFFVF